ncbi:TPA: hypothetical protein ACW72U_000882 [Enterobacter ludwigii]|uniref:hypothetical protein n=1 Tax=Enterobacter ludwigii TaxID=299767 RepID=UPI0018C26CE5|nr:hypothetical protein [Enterobacter ludwigii]MBG0699789.1 hypothetical protein [Enterobacter ludwigii]WGG67512.1 hypothetical protein QCL67_09305 [Enterobacter ludwigii]HDR2475544.1 hypothetical protein [Enterobacter ludwigii]HDR2655245.1 hypothetical protein [Enterobacter ludwigii]HDT0809489.1 hypothetical protein [Enterobacter ludwigii]
MNTVFFSNPDNQYLISNKLRELNAMDTDGEISFSKERDYLVMGALQLFLKHAAIWDERVQFNIQLIGETFIRELKTPVNEENLNLLFTSCFRFFMENHIFHKDNLFQLTEAIKQFAIYRQDEFDERSSSQITYTLKEMPLTMIREILSSDNAKSYQEYIRRANDLEDAGRHWDSILKENLAKSEKLNESLVMQANKFNFVGLYKGFAELGDNKSKELKSAKYLMFILGILIPFPLLIEILTFAESGALLSGWSSMAKNIPILSLTLILVYFFRVSLLNFNSIRAQLIQIDLRKSLCQFIQNYATYAQEIREHNTELLVKFEEVIFSNIMPSEDKIPSTFDGIEQLTNLIGALKK